MKAGVRGALIVIALLAVAVEGVGAVGWWSWRQVARVLGEDPVRGAQRLVESPTLRLPSVARRSRRMPGGDLARASDAAVAAALRAVGRDQRRWTPADPFGYANRARAELLEGDVADAAASLADALVRDPTSPALHRLAALAERARGRNRAALDHLATAEGLNALRGPVVVELTPEEQEWVRLEGLERRLAYYPRTRGAGVIALARELRARERTSDGRRTLEVEAADPRVVLELARWDLEDGRPDDAEARLAALTSRGSLPSSILAETWSTLALVREARGDLEGAVSAADRAIEYDPRSTAPYRVLAALAERRGDLAESLALLRRAWGMDPTDVGLLLNVARIAEKAGQVDDARLALERAVTMDPSNPGLRAKLVDLELRQGAFMRATLRLSDALDRFPTDPQLLGLADRLRREVNSSRDR